jgi:Xaa-Pro aminopeptidase
VGQNPAARLGQHSVAKPRIPGEDEDDPWNGALRLDIPAYVQRQLDALIYFSGYSRVSVVLNAFALILDDQGRQVFRIRPCDLVPDRRKIRPSRGARATAGRR